VPNDPEDAGTRAKQDDAFNPWKLAGMGTELLGAIIGPGLLGYLIDRWAGTLPRWTLILAGVGIIGGGYNFVRQAMALNRQAAAAWRSRPHPDSGPQGAQPTSAGMFESREATELPDDIRFPPPDDEPDLTGEASDRP